MAETHSPLYNYFITCWKYNYDFTLTNLDNAEKKGYITATEEAEIEAMPREV